MDRESSSLFDEAEGFPHLAAAPIVEVVVDWRAKAEAWPIDGLREQLVEKLPDYPDCHAQHRLEFQVEAQPRDEQTATQLRRERDHGFRFESANKLQIAQFTRDGFAFSRLAPYENWERLSMEARRLWNIFVDVAKPAEIQRLGVRFINRIPLAGLSKATECLAQPPRGVRLLKLPTSGFFYQTTYDVPQHPFKINVIETVQPSTSVESGGVGLILDIDVVTTTAMSPRDDLLATSLQQMHWLKNKAFFGLLKKRGIDSFRRVEQ